MARMRFHSGGFFSPTHRVGYWCKRSVVRVQFSNQLFEVSEVVGLRGHGDPSRCPFPRLCSVSCSERGWY